LLGVGISKYKPWAVIFFISWQNAPFCLATMKLITMVSPIFQRYEAALNLSLVNHGLVAVSVSMLIMPSIIVPLPKRQRGL
jgi:hypothetical protein